jgi:excisionase family DNA binding protein
MATTTPLLRLREALEAQRRSLQELEDALVEYGETLPSEDAASQHPASANGQDDDELHLLSIDEVCNTLGMGKSWTYRKLKSGEIPSIKLGRSIKVKRQDLKEYLEGMRYHPSQQEEAPQD